MMNSRGDREQPGGAGRGQAVIEPRMHLKPNKDVQAAGRLTF